tara:strand:+ start:549 stop:665 length:117 start_codon:yes stop_codon:yes gene_type:complete
MIAINTPMDMMSELLEIHANVKEMESKSIETSMKKIKK